MLMPFSPDQVLVNFGCFVALCLGLLLKTIFFGQLRPVEIEVRLVARPGREATLISLLGTLCSTSMTARGTSSLSPCWR